MDHESLTDRRSPAAAPAPSLTRSRVAAFALGSLCLAACGPTPPGAPPAPAPSGERSLPPIPDVRGALEIDVVHPPADETMAAVDSTFIFGSVGNGDATLTVSGVAVDVKPNGAWLAFVPVPEDGRYELVVRLGERTERATHAVNVAPRPSVDAAPGRLGIVPGSVRPAGALSVVRGEPVEISIQATPGADAALVLPDGRRVPLSERRAVMRQIGFGLDRTVELAGVGEYTGRLRLDRPLLPARRGPAEPTGAVPALSSPAGHLEPAERAAATGAFIELTLGGDSVRVPLEASIGVIEPDQLRVGVVATARPDSTAVGQLAPGSDQAWEYFWWNGTRLTLDGEAEGHYRVRLADDLHAWVAQGNVRLEPEGAPLPRGDVGPTITVDPQPQWIDLRFHGTDRLPYRVKPSTRALTVELYGATGRPAFVGYGPDDGFLDRVHWEQLSDERFRFHIELKERLWGFRTRWDEEGRLVVQVRRAPDIDPTEPFRNVQIAVDAGHPPGGATGPTRLKEADANLSVTRRLVPMLQERGARVLEIRPDTSCVPLLDRVMAVQEGDTDLSLSVHFNAFPDGVNPFENHGTHVFHYWPQAVELARELQQSIVGELGLRDRGIRFQNLAMARIAWTPAVLTETLFMMIPEHEAALYDERVQQRIAEAHLRGIERFLTAVGREQRETWR